MEKMQIQITGRHLEVTSALKSFIDDKLAKLEHHFDQILDVKVVLIVENNNHVAEAKLSVPGDDIVAKAEGENMYAAIDTLQDKLDRQVRKRKQKMKDHRVKYNRFDSPDMIDEAAD